MPSPAHLKFSKLLQVHIEIQYNSKKTDLSDEGGLSTHVGTCYDLKPALSSHQATIIWNKADILLCFNTRVPATFQNKVSFFLQHKAMPQIWILLSHT
jgi:hypothetical protein